MEVFPLYATVQRINYLELAVYHFSTALLDPEWHGTGSVMPVNRLYLPISGEAIVSVGGKTVAMVPGFAYLIPAGAALDYHCDNAMEKIFVHFNFFRPDRYDALNGLGNIYRIPFPVSCYHNLLHHGMLGTISGTLTVKNILYDLLTQFQDAYGIIDEQIPIYTRTVMNALAYVKENLSANLLLDDIAKHCFVSRSTLADMFRKEVGIPLGKYIDDQLILAAQRQLSQSADTIGQISNCLGYSNQCYFSRRFKQICGMSPQTYRTNNKI